MISWTTRRAASGGGAAPDFGPPASTHLRDELGRGNERSPMGYWPHPLSVDVLGPIDEAFNDLHTKVNKLSLPCVQKTSSIVESASQARHVHLLFVNDGGPR